MLVQGAKPLEIIRQYMAKGDSPTRGRELNIHFGDLERGFIGQISHLGDMVPVMAGVTLLLKMWAGVRADGNDVLAVYDVTKDAVERARAGEGVTLIELMTYRRKGHAEHDNQS